MIGRIVRPADFERVLATVQRSRSDHFALHHLLPGVAEGHLSSGGAARGPQPEGAGGELSTVSELIELVPVDDSAVKLGLVVPKRHAKRAVTRNLVKRQARAIFRAAAPRLPAGLWVLRLKAGIDRQRFVSARSEALGELLRQEMLELLARAERVVRSGAPARPYTPRRGPRAAPAPGGRTPAASGPGGAA
ncbi:ribonuclease P protein component [Ideonella livida]|uniref:Ribonuclease P protein component n=1 Tax=Ideonella livida TaxID=2707176 RepID=A0A7C9PJU0_9BURK|nr:ribonuclease P protein component [Ideonella livida]NDY92832.1 ribonuclease P protein component [Ideonella livida]